MLNEVYTFHHKVYILKIHNKRSKQNVSRVPVLVAPNRHKPPILVEIIT